MRAVATELVITVRTMTRAPGFAITAILTLMLGIGANLAIFNVVNAVVLHPLPFRRPDGIVSMEIAGRSSISAELFDRVSSVAQSYKAIGAYTGADYAFTGSGNAAHFHGARVSPSVFAILGVSAAKGRLFSDDEARRGDGTVAVLSDELWRTRFGGDASLIGKSVMLDGRSIQIVGVMPRGFMFPTHEAQLWTPAPLNPSDSSGYRSRMLTLIGRLAPTVDLGAATGELRLIRARIRAEDGLHDRFDPAETRVVSFASRLVGAQQASMFMLAGIVGIVLLIACANVANLVLLRATTRARELAIRSALGASRSSLVWLAMLEPVLVALIGGTMGLAVAPWTSRLLVTLVAQDAPLLQGMSLSPLVVAVAIVTSLAVAALIGLVPAAAMWRVGSVTTLRDGGRGGTSKNRVRSALVVSELGLAFVLALAAGLLAKSLWRLQHVDPGFRAERVLSLRVSTPTARYSTPASLNTYWDEVFERAAALPGVGAVGAIHLLPMGLNNWDPSLAIEGDALPAARDARTVDWRLVSPNYFRAMGIRVVRGRVFDGTDGLGTAGVAVVNATLARRYFGTDDPMGKRVQTVFEGSGNFVTIVGVVDDIRGHGLGVDPVPEMYRPLAQRPEDAMTLMVSTPTDPSVLAGSIRLMLAALDPTVIVDDVRPMSGVVSESIASSRHTTALIVSFGLLALVLAAVGVFGVVSFAVSQRTREFGIRAALGASNSSIRNLVLRQALTLAAIGVGVGSVLGMAGGQMIRSQLYHVEPIDPAILAAAVGTVVCIAAFAAWVPARRAARSDPAVALRYD